MPVFPVTVGSIKQNDHGPGRPAQKGRPYLQNTEQKLQEA
jgi:hypothetical protein